MATEPKLAQQLDELKPRVAQLETGVEHLSRSMDALATKFDAFATAVTSSGRTRWDILGTWAGIILIGVAMWTSPMQEKIAGNKDASLEALRLAHDNEVRLAEMDVQLQHMRKDLEAHAAEGGHPWRLLEKIQHLEGQQRATEANRFTAPQGASLEAKVETLIEMMQKEGTHHQHN